MYVRTFMHIATVHIVYSWHGACYLYMYVHALCQEFALLCFFIIHIQVRIYMYMYVLHVHGIIAAYMYCTMYVHIPHSFLESWRGGNDSERVEAIRGDGRDWEEEDLVCFEHRRLTEHPNIHL